jgi:two-component system response regulator MtrA
MARIIYVEDDDLVGKLVQQVLTNAGHLVGVIGHGTLAYETIAFKKPDLVILDRALPGMQGVEILKALRARPELYRTPIIMLTAKGGEEYWDEAMEAGANDYLLKPFEPSDLVLRVETVLRQTSFWREAAQKTAPSVPNQPGGDANG